MEATLRRELLRYPGTFLGDVRIVRESGKQVVSADVQTPVSFDPPRVSAMERVLPEINGEATELHVRSLIIKETTSSGYLHETTGPSD